MTVSIIIAAKTYGKNLKKCIDECLKLEGVGFEILIALDEYVDINNSRVKVISTGNVLPGRKRDLASKHAKGEILAFIDDDAYPDQNWLKNAVRHFQDAAIAAVGGPAITPPEESFRGKASGKVYENILLSGNYRYRYVKSSKRFVDDYPSCNLLVRKSVFKELGGFDTEFWPGEDTKLCWGIVHKLNKKILYDPQVLVYHHRRPLFLPHLKQIANYAVHRGYFVKKYPHTSLKLSYFVPSLFVLVLTAGLVLSFINPVIRYFFISFVVFYVLIVLFFSLNRDIKLALYVFFGIIFSHLTYGVFFIKGLLTKQLNK